MGSHPTGAGMSDGAFLRVCRIPLDSPQMTAVPRELHGALPALAAVAHRLCRVMREINKDPIRVGICRLQHLSDDRFGAGRFAGRRGGCAFAEVSHCGGGLCAVKRSRGMEDGGGQKVHGAGPSRNDTWETGGYGVRLSCAVHRNKHKTSAGVIPLKWGPTHSLLEEGPDSSGPEARSE